MLGSGPLRKEEERNRKDEVLRRPTAESKQLSGKGRIGPVPTSGEVTHVSALHDQFLLLTLKIKIKCITIDQFTRIWYICFGNVKQN